MTRTLAAERSYNGRVANAREPMPLSEHEQRILEDIERRLQQEDPRFAGAITRTSLTAHLVRRIRWGAAAFIAGFVMLMLFAVSVWVAIAGFAVMLLAALVVYQQLRRIGRDQMADYGGGRLSIAALLSRFGRFPREERRPDQQ